MATKQQRKFGGLPFGKKKLTAAELDAGMTIEQMHQRQREMKAAAMKRFLGDKAT